MAHSGIQQQRHPQQNHHCKDCGLYFDSVKSLDVHLHYHKENLLSKWANQLAGGTGNASSNNNAGDESNNNSHKTGNNNSKRNIAHDYGSSGIVAAPADSSDSMLKVGPPTPGAVPPGRPSSTSSIVFSRGSPPASSAFTHPPTPSSYSSAPSPYQVESNRFSPAGGGNFNFSNNRTPPSPQNGPMNPFSAFSSGTQTYIVDMRSSGDFFNENNSNFILGSGADFPTISSANTVRSSTPSSVSSPSPSSSVGPVTTTTSFRYHPYHQQNNMYSSSDRNGSAVSSSSIAQSSPSHSPQQCEKCGYVCDSSAALTEHLNVAHPPTPTIVSNQQQLFNQHQNMMVNRSAFQQQQQQQQHQQQQQLQQLLNMRQSLSNQNQQSGGAFNPFGNQNTSEGGNRLLHPHQIKSEDGSSFNNQNNGTGIGNQLLNQQSIKTEDEQTAEILDLDSQKVHVYQPPAEEEEELRDESGSNENPHSVSAMLWSSNNQSQQQKLFHHQQQQQQQQQHHQQQLHQQHMGVSPPEFGRGSMSSSSLTPPSSSSEGIIVPQQPMYQHRGYLSLQEQHPNNSSISSVPHQPIISSSHVPNMNPISSSLLPIHNPSQVHQKTTAMPNNIQSQGGATSNQSWKSNEARRPKTYNCSACNKWFTSSGHLKRHYNTTLHKNAVKQSGAPDPATMPITNHHHPSRDPIPGVQRTLPNMGDSSPVMSSPVPSLGGEESSRSDDNSHSAGFGRITPQHPHNLNLVPSLVPMPNQLQSSPPNLQAGPSASEIPSGGLLLLSSYNNNLPDSVHTSQGLLHPQSQHQYTVGVASPPNQTHQHPSQQTLHQQQHQQQQLGSHLIHHPIPQQPAMMHQRLQSIPTTNTSMTQTAFPNGLPPHVSITQMPVITSHHLITSTGNQLTGSNAIDDCQDNIVQNHTDLRNGIINMQHLFSSSIPNHHPLPSFAQFHQNHMYGFNGISATQENGYSSVSTSENVGGLSVSPDNQTLLNHHQSFSTSPGNNSNNNNSYSIMNLEEDINNMTSIDGDDRFSPPNHNNNNITNLRGSSDSSGSLGEDMTDLSPVGTPDCPTSTNGDFDHDIHKHHIKQEEGTNIISSSTNTVTTNGNIYKSSMISNGGIHKCLECDKVFNKACYLTQHNKSFHSGDKPFKCNRCGKRFPAEYLYQEHWGKHAGEKPYKCEICPKQFNHKTDLRRHLCLHTGEKPYACDICGKGFIRKDHMLKHCETHRKKIPQITVQ
ncbi:transcription factor Zelda [Anabrus simplex]|uniref:transcription factor Zelda n=1 Tax=Anabrus simplex TaxID=316456 RepID=UPI0035A2F838